MNALTKDQERKDKPIASSADILSSLRSRVWAKESKQNEAKKLIDDRLKTWMKTGPKLTLEEERSLREKLVEDSKQKLDPADSQARPGMTASS